MDNLSFKTRKLLFDVLSIVIPSIFFTSIGIIFSIFTPGESFFSIINFARITILPIIVVVVFALLHIAYSRNLSAINTVWAGLIIFGGVYVFVTNALLAFFKISLETKEE